MKYLILVISIIFLASCTENKECGFGDLSIRVVNKSSIDFDTLKFTVVVGAEESRELVFTNLESGKESDCIHLNQLAYYYYDDSPAHDRYIYFSNYFTGKSADEILFETGYGFCGTGLLTNLVSSGQFEAVITDVDLDKNQMFIEQLEVE